MFFVFCFFVRAHGCSLFVFFFVLALQHRGFGPWSSRNEEIEKINDTIEPQEDKILNKLKRKLRTTTTTTTSLGIQIPSKKGCF